VTVCSYSWKGEAPCPKHPGAKSHRCKRQQPHEPKESYRNHECKCGEKKMQMLGPRGNVL